MAVIILEGPDGSGKSTLAKRLSEMLDYPIHHFSYPTSEHEKKYMFEMYQEFCYANQNVIVDRCWYSEMVYGRVVRDKSYISVDQMLELERMLLSQGGAMLVYCTAPMNKLWERFKRRGDDYIKSDFDTLHAIHKGYEKLMKIQHFIPILRYEINENMPRM